MVFYKTLHYSNTQSVTYVVLVFMTQIYSEMVDRDYCYYKPRVA